MRYLVLLIELIAIVVGLKNWSKLKLGYRLIVVQVIIACFVELLGNVIVYYKLGSNAWMYNLYALVEAILLIRVYRLLSTKEYSAKLSLIASSIVLATWLIVIAINGFFVFISGYFIATSLLMIALYILIIIDNSIFRNNKLFAQPLFLFSIAVIIYFGSIIPLFGMLNHLVEVDKRLANNLFDINVFAAALRYALTGTALYLHGRNAVEDAHQ